MTDPMQTLDEGHRLANEAAEHIEAFGGWLAALAVDFETRAPADDRQWEAAFDESALAALWAELDRLERAVEAARSAANAAALGAQRARAS